MNNPLSKDKDYTNLFIQIKDQVRKAQVKATLSVNNEMLTLYWQIGNNILTRQKVANWGDNIINQLSKDLKKTFPNMKGFSTRNLKYMRRFAREYPSFEIGQPPVAQISWSHNIILFSKCEDQKERFRQV